MQNSGVMGVTVLHLLKRQLFLMGFYILVSVHEAVRIFFRIIVQLQDYTSGHASINPPGSCPFLLFSVGDLNKVFTFCPGKECCLREAAFLADIVKNIGKYHRISLFDAAPFLSCLAQRIKLRRIDLHLR